MSNIFRHTSETYFQVPNRLMADGIFGHLKPSSMALYLTVLKQAQAKSSTVVLFNTSTVLEAIAVAPRHLRSARAQLQEYNLVGSTEVKRGLWTFEILTPHGVGLNNSVLDLDKLSKDEVTSYYLPYLGDRDAIFTADGNLIARCPFHYSHKLREKPFHLKLTDDGNGIGVWNCFGCLKAGRMVEFEMQRTKLWSRVEAHKQVLNFFWRLREGDPNTPIQTTLPMPSGEHYQLEDEPTPI
jgi:hypothetical protein